MISAEFPTIAENLDNILQDIINSIIIYNLYGPINPNTLYIKPFSPGGAIWYSKNYPKQFTGEIIIL